MSPHLPDVPGYDVEEELGRGGMGVVYRARRRSTGAFVALKMILCGRDASFPELARFRIEAEALACLDHPNIIRIHDVGHSEGYPFLALEFAEGGSLKQLIARQRPPARWSAERVKTLALAMQHAHDRGMLHRDLKPANVLLTGAGVPKITDFGIVKFAARFSRMRSLCLAPQAPASALDEELDRFACEFASQYRPFMDGEHTPEGEVIRMTWQQCARRTGLLGDTTRTAAVRDFLTAARRPAPPAGRRLPGLDDLTASGSILGSPLYLSPEQARGDLHRIGRHTDVYGLGAILYELLTGRPPFRAANRADLLEQVRNVPPAPPGQVAPSVPGGLEQVCLKCLEKDVGRRFPTAAALAEALQRFLDEWGPGPEGQPPPGPGGPPEDQPGLPPTCSEPPGPRREEGRTRSWWPFRRKAR